MLYEGLENDILNVHKCNGMIGLQIYYAAMKIFTSIEPMVYSLCLLVIIGFLAHSQELA